MTEAVETWIEEAFGVVVVMWRGSSPDTIAWAAGWAADGGQPLTVVEPRASAHAPRTWVPDVVADALRAASAVHPRLVVHHRHATLHPEQLVAWLGVRASSIIVDGTAVGPGPVPGATAPHCPVLLLPPKISYPAANAPVLLAIGRCERCAVPMGFAYAHAARVGAPLQVIALADEVEPTSLDSIRRQAEVFASCYPDLDVTIVEPGGVPLETLARGAQLVVTGLAHDFPVRPSESDLLAFAGRPLALVPMAA